jgi:hypothetical protein
LDDIDILAEWGFIALRPRDLAGNLIRDKDGKPIPPVGGGKYGSHQIWRKRRVGKQTGTGRWFLDQHEILIAARRGNVPAPLPGTQDESVFDAPVGEHSEKPHEHVRAWIDRCWPHLSKIEVFARGTAPEGWKFWGNEAEPKSQAPASTPPLAAIAVDDDGLDLPSFLRRGDPACPFGRRPSTAIAAELQRHSTKLGWGYRSQGEMAS